MGRTVSDLFAEPDDATPLSREERGGLIPTHVSLRRELNELEQNNILSADVWAFQRRHDPVQEAFARGLHRRMFGKVWRWAGIYRTTDKNLGVPHALIQPRLYEVLDNVRHWVENATFEPDEIAARFHHGLVFVHPFPNGNGRWSRLMADLLIVRLGQPRFSLGADGQPDATKKAYIAALRAADQHDISPLIRFIRS